LRFWVISGTRILTPEHQRNSDQGVKSSAAEQKAVQQRIRQGDQMVLFESPGEQNKTAESDSAVKVCSERGTHYMRTPRN